MKRRYLTAQADLVEGKFTSEMWEIMKSRGILAKFPDGKPVNLRPDLISIPYFGGGDYRFALANVARLSMRPMWRPLSINPSSSRSEQRGYPQVVKVYPLLLT